MIRTFRLYQLHEMERIGVAKAQERLRSARLASIARRAPARLARVLSDLSKQLSSERIEDLRSRKDSFEMILRGRWPARSFTVSAGPAPKVPIEVRVWLRRSSSWLVVFEANRPVSQAASYLIADALAGGVENVTPLLLHMEHWKAIDKWLRRPRGGKGDMLGGHFYKAKPGGQEVEWIALRKAAGSSVRLLRDSLETASGIGELLIHTPYLESVDSAVTCRIRRSGSICIYGGDVTEGLVDALLFELEFLWSNIKAPPK